MDEQSQGSTRPGEPTGTRERVQHREEADGGTFFVERDGDRAEMTYVRKDPHLIIINHTYVPREWRGGGVGRQLVQAAVDWARKTNTRIIPVCSYAMAVFDREPALKDVLSERQSLRP